MSYLNLKVRKLVEVGQRKGMNREKLVKGGIKVMEVSPDPYQIMLFSTNWFSQKRQRLMLIITVEKANRDQVEVRNN